MDLQWVCFMIVLRYSGNQLAEWQNREISVALDWFNCTKFHYNGSQMSLVWQSFDIVGVPWSSGRHQIGSQVASAWQSNSIGVVMQHIVVDWQLSGFLLTAEWLLV